MFLLKYLSGNAEVSEHEISISIKHQILWLHITMHHTLTMHILKCKQHTSYHETSFRLVEEFIGKVVPQITT